MADELESTEAKQEVSIGEQCYLNDVEDARKHFHLDKDIERAKQSEETPLELVHQCIELGRPEYALAYLEASDLSIYEKKELLAQAYENSIKNKMKLAQEAGHEVNPFFIDNDQKSVEGLRNQGTVNK